MKNFAIILAGIALLVPASFALAQDASEPVTSCGREGGLVNVLPDGICTLEDILVLVLDLMVQIGSILLVVMLVFTGFKFVAAQGNAEEIQGARTALTWTVIGGLLLLGAEGLSLVIKATVESL